MQPENAYQDGGTSPPLSVHNVDNSEVKASAAAAFIDAFPDVSPELKPSRYHCSPEWHLSRLVHAPLAGVLYSFALRISAKSGVFHGSVLGIADYFDVSRWKVQRAIKALVDSEFFVRVAQETFQPSVYHVICHNDWAAKHPGCCAVKETFPWSGEEGDPLGKRLWNASGGKIRYMSFQVVALRSTGLTDDQIAAAFDDFVAAFNARREASGRHGRWSTVQPQFLRWLTGRLQQEELAKLGLQPFRTSGGRDERLLSRI